VRIKLNIILSTSAAANTQRRPNNNVFLCARVERMNYWTERLFRPGHRSTLDRKWPAAQCACAAQLVLERPTCNSARHPDRTAINKFSLPLRHVSILPSIVLSTGETRRQFALIFDVNAAWRRSWGLGVLTPMKVCRRGQSMFGSPKMPHSFIENCWRTTASLTSSRKKFWLCVKIKR